MGGKPVTIYGIKNCDTMKKARAWLQAQGVAHDFHDYKKLGIEATQLARWCQTLGWEKLLNRAGTTFRKLPDAHKTGRSAGYQVGYKAGVRHGYLPGFGWGLASLAATGIVTCTSVVVAPSQP